MITEEILSRPVNDVDEGFSIPFLSKEEANEMVHLARGGLKLKQLVEQENGWANLLAVVKLGRWAKQSAIPAMTEAREALQMSPVDYEKYRQIVPLVHFMDNALALLGDAMSDLDELQKSGSTTLSTGVELGAWGNPAGQSLPEISEITLKLLDYTSHIQELVKRLSECQIKQNNG